MNDVKLLRELIFGLAILSPIGCQNQPTSPGDGSQASTSVPERNAETSSARDDAVPTPGDDEVDEVAPPPRRVTVKTIKIKRARTQSIEHVGEAAHMASRVAMAVVEAKGEERSDEEVVDAFLQHRFHGRLSGPEARCLTASQVDGVLEGIEDTRRKKPSRMKDVCPPSLRMTSYSAQGVMNGYQPWRLEGKIGDDPTLCCYSEEEFVKRRHMSKGRLFYVEGRVAQAATRGTRQWMGAGVEAPLRYSEADLERAAHAWLEDALEEHASIAAFSRATLELMALGAPSELLAEYQRASLDEIKHARACFSLVAALVGEDVSADRIAVEGPRSDLDVIIADVFWGGCVGESIAALCAQRALRGCEWEAARAALAEISEDEARHAALAWSTLSFLGEVAPERVRRLLESVEPPGRAEAAEEEVDEAWVALGRLTPAQEARAEADAWDHLILPMRDALLERA